MNQNHFITIHQMKTHFLILRNQRNSHEQKVVKCEGADEPLPLPARKPVKARRLVTKLPGEGKWSKKEQTAYINFLGVHYEIMRKSKLRKAKKIFIKMSKAVRTRVPEQCRSHHQKMIQLHGSLEEVIRFFNEEVFPLDQPPKVIKTEAKVEHDPIEGLYRIQRTGNAFRLEVNAQKVACY